MCCACVYVCVVTVPFCGNRPTCRKEPTISGTNRTLSIPAEGQGPGGWGRVGESNAAHAADAWVCAVQQAGSPTQLLPVVDHEVVHDNSHVSTPVVRDEQHVKQRHYF